jgi:hypothetical protein
MPRKPGTASAVLTIRVPRALERKLAARARRHRQTRSEAARLLLEAALNDTPDEDPAAESRRLSRLVSRRDSETDALDFISHAADLRGRK